MNGPEHYAKAQRLAEESGHSDREMAMLAQAQVHATLALAAATAAGGRWRVTNSGPVVGMDGANRDAWQEVAGVVADPNRGPISA